MARNCILYNFSKRVNSTKQPTGGTAFACDIKHDTDFINPTFEIQATDLSGYNYMSFNGCYYYITNLVSHRTGVWEVTGARDPLATYKDNIKSGMALCLYSTTGADAGVSYLVPDERIPISRDPSFYNEVATLAGSLFQFSGIGSYILSVVGESNGVKTYIVDRNNMVTLINGLSATLGTRIWNAIPDNPLIMDEAHMLYYLLRAGHEVWKSEASYGNYASLIRSCYWIPFSFSSNEGTPERIYIGDYPTDAYGSQYLSSVLTTTLALNIPWPVNDWKRNNCIAQLYLPLCGKVVLPIDKIIDQSAISVNVSLDILSGSLSYQVNAGGYTVTISGCVAAASYAIGSNNVSLSSVISGIANVVGGGIRATVGSSTGNPMQIAGGVTSVAEGITQVITPELQVTGAMTGISGVGLQQALELELLYYPPIGETAFQNKYGHPRMILSNAASDGYYHFRGYSVECSGTPEEKRTINAYANSGIFIE